MSNIRVRIAPSPTGFMHVGNFRTALYNYLFARKNDGEFIVRLEDTDQKRYVEGAAENLIRSLKWSGLNWDEGVFLKTDLGEPIPVEDRPIRYVTIGEKGNCGPYIQSRRLDKYKKYAEQLVKDGHAYYCFCEPERLEEMRREQQASGKPPIYDQYCLRNISPEEINKKLKENCPYTIRLKVPKDQTIEFEDIIRGKITFDTNLINDQILLKSDGYPTYHLGVVVDDHEMNISHVIRGEEWLPSTPKHIFLYKAFGWETPQFAHVPLLLNTDKSKLSKRQGDVAVEDYIKKGYLKEALINFVALLGWNPGEGATQEIFTLEELVDKFSLERVHKGGAVFDLTKLNWINSQWIKKLSIDELYERSLEFWKQKEFYNKATEEKKSEDYIKKILSVERDRLSTLSEVGESNKFFFTENVSYDKELLHWKDMTDSDLLQSLEKSRQLLENIQDTDWTRENLEKTLFKAAGDKRGELLWPLRVALTGEKKSPSPFDVAWVLGKKESLKRINNAIKLVG